MSAPAKRTVSAWNDGVSSSSSSSEPPATRLRMTDGVSSLTAAFSNVHMAAPKASAFRFATPIEPADRLNADVWGLIAKHSSIHDAMAMTQVSKEIRTGVLRGRTRVDDVNKGLVVLKRLRAYITPQLTYMRLVVAVPGAAWENDDDDADQPPAIVALLDRHHDDVSLARMIFTPSRIVYELGPNSIASYIGLQLGTSFSTPVLCLLLEELDVPDPYKLYSRVVNLWTFVCGLQQYDGRPSSNDPVRTAELNARYYEAMETVADKKGRATMIEELVDLNDYFPDHDGDMVDDDITEFSYTSDIMCMFPGTFLRLLFAKRLPHQQAWITPTIFRLFCRGSVFYAIAFLAQDTEITYPNVWGGTTSDWIMSDASAEWVCAVFADERNEHVLRDIAASGDASHALSRALASNTLSPTRRL
jgi:hypothetical protein